MAGNNPDKSRVPQLTTALDHAWHWYDLRINAGMQVLNFYLLGVAVLISAYVSALNSRNHGVAVVVAVIAAAVTYATYVVGVRQDRVARIALSPIAELEDRLANELQIDSIRLVDQYQGRQGKISTYDLRGIARFVVPVLIIVCVAAAIYAGIST